MSNSDQNKNKNNGDQNKNQFRNRQSTDSPVDGCRGGAYHKLSKDIYIELAAFSDSIYDRGRTKI